MSDITTGRGTATRFKNQRPLIGPGSKLAEAPDEEPAKVEASPKGEEQLPLLSQFVSMLIRFQYHECPVKMLAVPRLEFLPGLYYCLSKQELTRVRTTGSLLKNKVYEPIPDEKHWGEYTLLKEMFNIPISDFSEYRISVVLVRAKVNSTTFTGKLLPVAEKVVQMHNPNHFISDVRHLMYLFEHPDKVPDVMKNGKGNIFAGTTIMIGSEPHVISAAWQGTRLVSKFLPLSRSFTEDIQFVMIRK